MNGTKTTEEVVEDLNAAGQSLVDALKERDRAVASLRSALSEAVRQRDMGHPKLTDMRNERDAARYERDAARYERDAARCERDAARCERDATQTRNCALDTERCELRREVTALHGEVAVRTKERDRARTDALKDAHAAWVEVCSLNRQLGKANAEIADLKGREYVPPLAQNIAHYMAHTIGRCVLTDGDMPSVRFMLGVESDLERLAPPPEGWSWEATWHGSGLLAVSVRRTAVET